MDWPPVPRNSDKQAASPALVLRIVFKQPAAGQSFKDIVQRKVFGNHLLMGVNGESNLSCPDLFSNLRLDFVGV